MRAEAENRGSVTLGRRHRALAVSPGLDSFNGKKGARVIFNAPFATDAARVL
jgi:hypothetical protein